LFLGGGTTLFLGGGKTLFLGNNCGIIYDFIISTPYQAIPLRNLSRSS